MVTKPLDEPDVLSGHGSPRSPTSPAMKRQPDTLGEPPTRRSIVPQILRRWPRETHVGILALGKATALLWGLGA
eukprot:5206231-Pyramimonas_sp.AAC.1